MKILHYLLLPLLGLSLLSSCKKSDSSTPYGKLQISFMNEANGKPVAFGPMDYTNAAGNRYSIDLLKYYVSHFSLTKADGSEKVFNNYELIDASNPSSLSFTLDSVLNGEYNSVSFYLGIDSARNHTGAQDGALDPANGMIWVWSTGYIFFKHEGSFKDTAGNTKSLIYHYGTDDAFVKITVPISNLRVEGNTKKLFLKLNLDHLYSSVHQINFNDDNVRMSGADDAFWIYSLSKNFPKAFEYVKSE